MKVFWKNFECKTVYINATRGKSRKNKSTSECELWIVLIHAEKNGLYAKFCKYWIFHWWYWGLHLLKLGCNLMSERLNGKRVVKSYFPETKA